MAWTGGRQRFERCFQQASHENSVRKSSPRTRPSLVITLPPCQQASTKTAVSLKPCPTVMILNDVSICFFAILGQMRRGLLDIVIHVTQVLHSASAVVSHDSRDLQAQTIDSHSSQGHCWMRLCDQSLPVRVPDTARLTSGFSESVV